ncbi:ATP-binding cassette domain-containing protein [Vallicoccus soli]|uniref:ATP-binding cassette domain-containing protein n=1 Tax=Vallicoccus soli TaxID=2339232 RepID=A0A3A3YU34_9ACTN|nr:ATP-binding cassette domain-containing protein [Vallicoccus soli]RJK94205.1 ATP-binding cassette domain-containing protein [Vallicoccus soli]
MIVLEDVVKRYGDHVAVDGLTLTARPGVVTGFLGPNGAGKSTSLRVLLGLDRPDRGTALVAGVPYASLRAPLHLVGALLDARAVAPRRGARPHLLALARSNGISARRVDEVLGLCGLEAVAERPAGGYSLGMAQRLGIAAALLGDPPVLVLDEPVNGLDPDGIIWIRELLRGLAAEGRTVLLSSHLMSEMAVTAEDLVVVGRGRLVAQTTVRAVVEAADEGGVLVRTPDAGAFATLLRARGLSARAEGGEVVRVRGTRTDEVGEIAAAHRVTLLELSPQRATLEEAYLRLTRGAVQFRGAPGRAPEAPRGPRAGARAAA